MFYHLYSLFLSFVSLQILSIYLLANYFFINSISIIIFFPVKDNKFMQ